MTWYIVKQPHSTFVNHDVVTDYLTFDYDNGDICVALANISTRLYLTNGDLHYADICLLKIKEPGTIVIELGNYPIIDKCEYNSLLRLETDVMIKLLQDVFKN